MTKPNSPPTAQTCHDCAAAQVAGALEPTSAEAFLDDLHNNRPEALRAWSEFAPVAETLARDLPAVTPSPFAATRLRERLDQARLPRLVGISVQRGYDTDWEPAGIPGIERRVLSADPGVGRVVCLFRMAPGARFPAHHHAGVEECYVLEGDLRVGDLVLRAGDYQRAEPGSAHVTQTTEQGCVCLIIAPFPAADRGR